MAKDPKEEKKSGGCFDAGFRIIMLLIVGLIIFFFGKTFVAQDLTKIQGYHASKPEIFTSAVDIPRLIKNGTEQRQKIMLTEEMVNKYLSQHLQLKQAGALANFGLKAKAVWVKFHADNKMEVIIERELFGRPHTVSMFVVFSTHVNTFGKDQFTAEYPGGRFGTVGVAPGFLRATQQAFYEIAESLEPRLTNIVGEMSRITFEDGKVILDPSLPDPGAL